jgi:hypothetical protein
MGDAPIGNHFGRVESTPNKRAKKFLRNNFKGCEADELRASMLCSSCHQVFGKPEVEQRFEKEDLQFAKYRAIKRPLALLLGKHGEAVKVCGTSAISMHNKDDGRFGPLSECRDP